jgi:6-pyruvoyltetrahydropterin/6-carboxytetrahydropterin synthase
MYIISKEFHFSASHVLNGLPDIHPCSRLHGHNYIITVFLKSEHLNSNGFVKDYRELDIIKKYIDEVLDHRHLNDQIPANPTAENIAKHIYNMARSYCPEVYKVSVSETPKTNATYEEA